MNLNILLIFLLCITIIVIKSYAHTHTHATCTHIHTYCKVYTFKKHISSASKRLHVFIHVARTVNHNNVYIRAMLIFQRRRARMQERVSCIYWDAHTKENKNVQLACNDVPNTLSIQYVQNLTFIGKFECKFPKPFWVA